MNEGCLNKSTPTKTNVPKPFDSGSCSSSNSSRHSSPEIPQLKSPFKQTFYSPVKSPFEKNIKKTKNAFKSFVGSLPFIVASVFMFLLLATIAGFCTILYYKETHVDCEEEESINGICITKEDREKNLIWRCKEIRNYINENGHDITKWIAPGLTNEQKIRAASLCPDIELSDNIAYAKLSHQKLARFCAISSLVFLI